MSDFYTEFRALRERLRDTPAVLVIWHDDAAKTQHVELSYGAQSLRGNVPGSDVYTPELLASAKCLVNRYLKAL